MVKGRFTSPTWLPCVRVYMSEMITNVLKVASLLIDQSDNHEAYLQDSHLHVGRCMVYDSRCVDSGRHQGSGLRTSRGICCTCSLVHFCSDKHQPRDNSLDVLHCHDAASTSFGFEPFKRSCPHYKRNFETRERRRERSFGVAKSFDVAHLRPQPRAVKIISTVF